jgi:hypothetical protein
VNVVETSSITQETESVKGRRRREGVVALVLLIIGTGIAVLFGFGPSGSFSDAPPPNRAIDAQWRRWETRFHVLLTHFDTTYAATGVALSSNDQRAAKVDLEVLRADSAHLLSMANSVVPQVNSDLTSLAQAAESIAMIGLAHWPQIDLATFSAADDRYTAAASGLSVAVASANHTY